VCGVVQRLRINGIHIYLTVIGFQPGGSSTTTRNNRHITRITRIQNTFKQNTTIKDTTAANTETIKTTATTNTAIKGNVRHAN
jgi:uncharacterized protein (DUF1786 family)